MENRMVLVPICVVRTAKIMSGHFMQITMIHNTYFNCESIGMKPQSCNTSAHKSVTISYQQTQTIK